jgi:hypothetical protein
MKKNVLKEKRYDCDFYREGSDIPYRTAMNMSWSQVREAKRNAKVVGDKVIHTYSHTESFEV